MNTTQTNINQTLNSTVISYLFRCMNDGQFTQPKQQRIQHLWSALKITIGGLIIRGYRIFKYMLQNQCIIFFKIQKHRTKYLFFKMTVSSQEYQSKTFYKGLVNCVKEIQKFKKKSLLGYSVLILYGLDYSTLQIQGNQQLIEILNKGQDYNQIKLLQILPIESYTYECFAPPINAEQQKRLPTLEQEHRKLKQVLHYYIDTFGQKYKKNFYSHLNTQFLYLFNTLNMIIFQETKAISKPGQSTPVYNQIQSSSWTVFRKGSLQSDRKDIVLSGCGNILFLDLIFDTHFKYYLNQEYLEEVGQLMKQCEYQYVQAKVKVVNIQNNLTPLKVYKFERKTVQQFSKTPVFS